MSPAPSFTSRGVAVYDDLLEPSAYQALLALHVATPGEPALLPSTPSGPRAGDVPALRGPSHHVRHAASRPLTHDSGLPTALVPLYEGIFAAAATCRDVVGLGERGGSLSMTPWTYRPGSAFDAHVDGPEAYVGGFVFFLVEDWPLHFGGLLVVVNARHSSADATLAEEVPHWRTVGHGVRYAPTSGISHAIHPRSNRLVLLAPDVVHLVTRVEAGAAPRRTYVGFFSS